ncbi:MAG: hypothetical protein IT518_18550 [Burkholderiales bacterium]|nr:hypothetical protein [Burkholderiales bacterium]
MKSATIVYDELTIERQDGYAFDAWYANHYLKRPLEQGLATTVRHYGSPARGAYLAVYEAVDRQATDALARTLDAEHPAVARAERFVGEQIFELAAAHARPDAIESRICYPVFFRVPAEREQAFDEWYDREHVRMLLECRHWSMCRRFRIRSAPDGYWTHVAMHFLTDPLAYASKERAAARSTPWRLRLESEPWFRSDNRVFFRHGREPAE